jgi:type IV secretion system protein VirB10
VGSQAAAQSGWGGGDTRALGGAPRQTELGAKLVPTQVSAVTASVLPHQPYLITRGTQIQCVLITAIDSTLPGPISCRLPTDVLGKTGLVLLDRGTIIVGEAGGSMTQGQNRLFALWTRAETPNGVVINLDSPAADPVGRAGMEGAVENHFWERIGGALLLSVVQGAMQVATSAVSPNGSTSLNLGGTESAVAEALRGSVNIRPTLRMNQGDNVSISVIRDLDFSSVYRLSVR